MIDPNESGRYFDVFVSFDASPFVVCESESNERNLLTAMSNSNKGQTFIQLEMLGGGVFTLLASTVQAFILSTPESRAAYDKMREGSDKLFE